MNGRKPSDTRIMETAQFATPERGEVVAVLRRQDPSRQTIEGRIARASSGGAAVKLPNGDLLTIAEPVVLVVPRDAGRIVARAQVHALHDSMAVFRLEAPWSRWDMRRGHRYEVAGVAAEVRTPSGDAREDGWVVDFSAGGMAVMVARKLPSVRLDVWLKYANLAATLRCRLVGTREATDGVKLHLQFEPATPHQHAFIRNMVAELEATYEAVRSAA
jgi:hypothetical protein